MNPLQSTVASPPVAPPPPPSASVARSSRPRSGLFGHLLSIVVVPAALAAGYGLSSSAGPRYDYTGPSGPVQYAAPMYLSLTVYAAALAVLVGAVLISVGFFRSSPAHRLALLVRGNLVAASAVGIGAAGDVFLQGLWNWTSVPVASTFYEVPTLNLVVTRGLAALAAGASAALLPALAAFLLRRNATP